MSGERKRSLPWAVPLCMVIFFRGGALLFGSPRPEHEFGGGTAAKRRSCGSAEGRGRRTYVSSFCQPLLFLPPPSPPRARVSASVPDPQPSRPRYGYRGAASMKLGAAVPLEHLLALTELAPHLSVRTHPSPSFLRSHPFLPPQLQRFLLLLQGRVWDRRPDPPSPPPHLPLRPGTAHPTAAAGSDRALGLPRAGGGNGRSPRERSGACRSRSGAAPVSTGRTGGAGPPTGSAGTFSGELGFSGGAPGNFTAASPLISRWGWVYFRAKRKNKGDPRRVAPCVTRRSLLFSVNPHPTFFVFKLRFGAFRCVRGAPGPACNWCCEEEEGGAG